MTVTVVSSDDGADEQPEEVAPEVVPGMPHSPLALLRGKRAAMDAKLHVDLKVPRWDEVLDGRCLWVRYGPGNPTLFAQSMQKREQAHLAARGKGMTGDPEWMVKANADVLVAACIAVYDLAVDEQPPEGDLPDGEYPTFASPELSEAVGAAPSAAATVMKVYGTGPDILVATNQLLNWSGESSQEADKSFLTS